MAPVRENQTFFTASFYLIHCAKLRELIWTPFYICPFSRCFRSGPTSDLPLCLGVVWTSLGGSKVAKCKWAQDTSWKTQWLWLVKGLGMPSHLGPGDSETLPSSQPMTGNNQTTMHSAPTAGARGRSFTMVLSRGIEVIQDGGHQRMENCGGILLGEEREEVMAVLPNPLWLDSMPKWWFLLQMQGYIGGICLQEKNKSWYWGPLFHQEALPTCSLWAYFSGRVSYLHSLFQE